MSCWFAVPKNVVCIADPNTSHKKHLRQIGIVSETDFQNKCTIQYGSDGPFVKNVSIFELIKIPMSVREAIAHAGDLWLPGE